MFENNPDGCGFMYPLSYGENKTKDICIKSRTKVAVRKGFMFFEDFWDAFNETFDEGKIIDVPVVFHFRIRTHGNADEGATQPIAISNKNRHLRSTEINCSCAVAHNGIIHEYCDEKSKLSDSQLFARDFLTVLKLYQDITVHKANLIEKAIGVGNKMVVMNANGEYAIIGSFQEHNGCYYSNDSYLPYVYIPKSHSKYDKRLYDDYWYGFNRSFSCGYMKKKDAKLINKELENFGLYDDKYDL